MFACRVLVGQYVKGESRYRRPPARDAAGNLYDTCVNDVREPTIYVVFKQSQVYPEFLITYEKSRFPNSIPTVQSNRTANVVNDVLDVSRAASVIGTSSHPEANADVTSSSTSTGETSSVSIPTVRNLLYTGLNSPVNPDKDVFLGSGADGTKSLNVVLAPPKSELSIHSKATQGLTSSSLLIESDQGLCTSPVFSSSDNLLTAAKPSPSDNTAQSGIGKNQQPTLTVCAADLANERRFVKDSLNSPPFRSLALAKSATDSLDPFSRSSDKAKILDASPVACVSEMESKRESSWDGSLVCFSEIRSSENASQRFEVSDDVIQTASGISTSFSITPGSTSTGEEFVRSKPAQGSTSQSYTGLPRTSAQDLLPSMKIPVSLRKPSLTDSFECILLRPNPDMITTQRSQSSEQDSQKPTVQRELVNNFSHPLAMPSSTARARNLNSEASSASSHSAQKISMMYKTSSSSAEKQSRSAGSSSSSSVSFYEIQPSALSRTQTPPKSGPQASSQKYVPEPQNKREKCVMM